LLANHEARWADDPDARGTAFEDQVAPAAVIGDMTLAWLTKQHDLRFGLIAK
jgi:hypothetical protein